MKENCVNCKQMKVMTFLADNEKTFWCHKFHINSRIEDGHYPITFEKKLNPSGIIDGMTHRLEFKKAKTCKDFDDMRPDELDKRINEYVNKNILHPDTTVDEIIGRDK